MMRPGLRFFIAIAIILTWIGLNFFLFRLTINEGWGLRYLCLPPVILLIALYLGVRYIHSAYNLTDMREGMKYFFACMFGFGYPVLVIGEGKAYVDAEVGNLILKIGGPGKLIVRAGSVALVEDFRGRLRVLGPGGHFLSRYEIVKEYASLEERYRPIEELSARSKDGIEVVVRDIRYRYRIAGQSGSEKAKGMDALLQFYEEAVIQMVYNRTMTERGIGSWEEGVNGVVASIITDFVRTHMVDYLTAPKNQDVDPRAEIYAELNSRAGQQKFRERGAELVWIDIGHFETPEKIVAGQRVSTWQARLQGDANKERAIGEAQRSVYQEMGRAEAQAGMIMSIIDSLESIHRSGDAHQNMRAIYLARIAQFLDTIGEAPRLTGSNKGE